MADDPPRGPEVPPGEVLLRAVMNPDWWDPEGDYVSSAIFGFPKFSAYVESMTTEEAVLDRCPDGSGMIQFNCGVARELGFNAHLEPEHGEDSHANYRKRTKKQSRKLLQAKSTKVTVKPDLNKLR